MPKLLPGVKDNLMEFGEFMDQCDTHEQTLHRLFGISVAEAVQYQELIDAFATLKKRDGSPQEQRAERHAQILLFGAWFALYKRKKR